MASKTGEHWESEMKLAELKALTSSMEVAVAAGNRELADNLLKALVCKLADEMKETEVGFAIGRFVATHDRLAAQSLSSEQEKEARNKAAALAKFVNLLDQLITAIDHITELGVGDDYTELRTAAIDAGYPFNPRIDDRDAASRPFANADADELIIDQHKWFAPGGIFGRRD
jgi:hypothetical protein